MKPQDFLDKISAWMDHDATSTGTGFNLYIFQGYLIKGPPGQNPTPLKPIAKISPQDAVHGLTPKQWNRLDSQIRKAIDNGTLTTLEDFKPCPPPELSNLQKPMPSSTSSPEPKALPDNSTEPDETTPLPSSCSTPDSASGKSPG